MDLVEPLLAIAEKLYSLCGEAKANKSRCSRLAERVRLLMDLLQTVNTLGAQPEQVKKGLEGLKVTLESAQEEVKKYTSTNRLKRFLKAYDLGEEFEMLNERLNDAAQLLSLALQADQKEKLDNIFSEESRRREDEADRENDIKEMMKLLQHLAEQTKETVDAVHETVDSTKKDVQVIKTMLESLKRPSLHLQDIKEINPEDLEFDFPKKPIMTSPTSEVYKGEYNKFTVAIKRYKHAISTTPRQVRNIFNKEVETMKRFESPNILRMFGICVMEENGPSPIYLIVMEFCEKGSLRQVLDGNCKLSWERRACMSLDAAQGLYRLHQSEHKFKVHGCINSSKFLVDDGYRVKLGGFELAKTETSLKRNKSGKTSSLCYCSPQQLQNINHPYDRVCEMYSFGIVLWEIATRQIPFKDCPSAKEIKKKVCEEQVSDPLPEDCPRDLADLINSCRSYDPFCRPTAGELVDKLRKMVQRMRTEGVRDAMASEME